MFEQTGLELTYHQTNMDSHIL